MGAHYLSQNLKKRGLHLSFDSSRKVSIDSVLALTSVIAEEMVLDLAD